MSDTYAIVKEHARSGWLLERARIITEIEQDLHPDKLREPPYTVRVRALTLAHVHTTALPACPRPYRPARVRCFTYDRYAGCTC